MTAPRDDHSRWEELAVGHALSALEPDDEEAFVRHVRTCEHCARTIADTQQAMAELAGAVEPVEPPASLRASILARAFGAERGGKASTGEPGENAPTEDGSGSLPPDELESRRQQREGRHARARGHGVRIPRYAAAAAVAVVLVLAAGNVVQLLQNGTQRTELAQARQVVNCVERDDCRALPIRATGNASVPAMALVQDGHVRLMVDGLQPNDAGSSMYVLWQQSGGTLRAVSAFDVNERGVSVIDGGRLGSSLADTAFLAVSHERGDAIPPKPSDPIAVGTVAS